jgi:hypothetical protein
MPTKQVRRRVTPNRAPVRVGGRESAPSPHVPAAPSRDPQSQFLGLQRLIGNQAVLRTDVPLQRSPGTVQRKLETIEGEQVDVADDKEKAEAETIIKTLKNTYGLEVNSTKGIDAIKDQYDEVPKTVLNSLSSRQWRMIDLRSLQKCMEHYATILGAERAKSTRSGEAQEVQIAGKVKQAIDDNDSMGKLDTDTLGEYFEATKTMNLFQAQEGSRGDFSDEGKQLVGTFVHEMAHGLLSYAYDDFVKSSGGYWRNQDKRTKKRKAEAPITDYGTTNAREDLCETAMYYFVEPDTLLKGTGGKAGKAGNPAPLRHAFMKKVTNGWLPPPPAPINTGPEGIKPEKAKQGKPEKKPWWNFWK